jgi:23S rRNA (cytidine2498-2'-O)-methyltransferase
MDWMISDVVAFPKRILDLLENWVGGSLCRFFIVTLKFRGQEDYPMLEDVKRLLEPHCEDFFLRRLRSNKNEITVMGATG